ncbi:glucose/arabinose dehydrogenase/regulation of enolase protein 1 (concanavalin A-like superfamily)/mono/diheme cytochrome c family protein [Haloferula luteola]|uniref:Glucose/arabinose dehydrogenase/regulation of enolase protein 1 (Concanavalin A-like superfamily)/mono/diheme cytochrome c family protein n=1 Tax=Haloferula luteola TaxID=595692 RepID=A0A840V999_9BACT|nr:LamG-like jellyroll fold domain-containing protein [Haloferula luteola]MBB5352164.1 glucose/arabinose dehydrogenase/regulation of enolase protein 1 (concanavalin A-like superfamily)/mono/diheme cytochrome c family protein [Haloferula luteola]
MAQPKGLLLSALFAILSSHLPAQTHGLSERPTVGPYWDGTFPTEPPAIPTDYSTVLAFPNLTFLNPVGLTSIPGTQRLIVWEREGKIWSFENDPETTEKTLVIDLSGNTQGWDDSGMLAVAPHPDFQNNRQIFVYYNWRGGISGASGDLGPVLGDANNRPPTATPTRDRLSRFTLDATYQADPNDEYVVIDQQDATVWHNGGGMFFHPDNGFLYLTNGDDANPGRNGQVIDTGLFSGVLRIDVDQRGGDISHPPTVRAINEISPDWPRYFIPNDNPFVGQPEALEEFYALGLRSPHRMTVDAITGRIFIGDVGAEAREEISVIEPDDPPGLNFQWPRIEGNTGDLTPPYPGISKRPIIDYPHGTGDGSCVIGGYVYRGSRFPELFGKYLFGDNMSGIVWYLDESVSPATKVPLAILPDGPGPNSGNDYRGLGSFGTDAQGEIYLCQLSSTEGRIYKLDRGATEPGEPLPATLSATGIFQNLTTLEPGDQLIPYEINAPFWSDGAVKTRFAMIPAGTTVGFHATGGWDFPPGSVFVKHFQLPVDASNPSILRNLETRVLVVKEDGEVYGATYKWRADQTEADLLDGSLAESVTITTDPWDALTSVDIGNPTYPGSTSRNGNLVTIHAGGTDIWNTSDQFHFAHQTRTGDFDVAVRVESVVQSDLYTKSGLMVRDSLAPDARHIMALVFPSNAERNNNTGGYEFQYRATTGGNATALYPPLPQPTVSYPNTWLRLQRSGDTFIAYSGSDGFTWMEYARVTLDFPDSVEFGLAVTAHTADAETTARFEVGTRRQPWYYPSRSDCLTCHNPQAGGALGLNTRQFNRTLEYPNGITDEQLLAWDHVGLFDTPLSAADLATFDRLHDHDDTTSTLQQRAKSYLDSNCAYCHRPNGVQAFWDARYDAEFSEQGIYYGMLVNELGDADNRVVVPADLDHSVLYRRVNTNGEIHMPPLARNRIDEEGVAMLAEWILSLPEEEVAAPTQLTALPTSNSTVELAWADLSDNEQGFVIERSIAGGAFGILGYVDPGSTRFIDTAAAPFQENTYRVKAYGEYVQSDPSNSATAIPDVGPPAPEIQLAGLGTEIFHADLVPDLLDGTDFGVVTAETGPVTRTFTLRNLGNLPLQLTTTPAVTLQGPGSPSFSLTITPESPIAARSETTFSITFDPIGASRQEATVSIASNDPDEPLFTFAIAGTPLDVGLVAWWRLDDGSGTTAMDATGAGHNGTFSAPLPVWNSAGHLGGSLTFSGEQGQSLEVPSHPDLNPTTALTLTAWGLAADWSGNRRIIQKSTNDNQYRLLAEGGALVFEITNIGRIESALPSAGSWHHFAATYDGSLMILYVDGIPVAWDEASGAIPTTNDPLWIGTKTPNSIAGDHWSGDLDEIRLYNLALSGADIAALAEASLDSGLVAHWPLDASSGTVARDTSGRGHHGTLTSPYPSWVDDGRLGQALAFDHSIGQSVTVASTDALNPPVAISISAWVRANNWIDNGRILQKGSSDNQYRFHAENGFFIWQLAGIGRLEAPLPDTGRWVHVAATFDGLHMILYYDGEEIASADHSGLLASSTDPLYLGTKLPNGSGKNTLDGDLDDVRLYARALTSKELATLAVQGSRLSLTATDSLARRGTGDTAEFTLSRTGPTTHALEIPLSFEESATSATPGIDFTTSPLTSYFLIPAGASSATLRVTPLDATHPTGPRTLTLIAEEIDGYTADPASATAVLEDSPVNEWKIESFGGLTGAASDQAADDADPDGDGLDNLLEAALGTHPLHADTDVLPAPALREIDGIRYLTSTYRRPHPALEGLSYWHQTGTHLGTDWQPAMLLPGYPLDHGDGTETVIFASPTPIPEAPRQFLRLRVSRP